MSLPEGYVIRRLEINDYDRGVLKTLSALTTVGEIPREKFQHLINQWNSLKIYNSSDVHVYNPIVIHDTNNDTIVATGNIFIEEKIIHSIGLVGHIEDISVDESQQGKKLGKHLINELTRIGKESGAYKIILDCDVKNVGFYEKCGYKEAGIEMSIRFDK